MAEINGVNVPFVPITEKNNNLQNKSKAFDNSFDNIFREELEKVKFSNHAMKRLEARNINLDEAELQKIEDAVKRAEGKGSRDSLVMMNDTAFIVNIPNKTVVTAMELGTGDDVFTNIDSVVFT